MRLSSFTPMVWFDQLYFFQSNVHHRNVVIFHGTARHVTLEEGFYLTCLLHRHLLVRGRSYFWPGNRFRLQSAAVWCWSQGEATQVALNDRQAGRNGISGGNQSLTKGCWFLYQKNTKRQVNGKLICWPDLQQQVSFCKNKKKNGKILWKIWKIFWLLTRSSSTSD